MWVSITLGAQETYQVVQRRHAAAGTSRGSAGRTTRTRPVVRERLGTLATERECARGTCIATLRTTFPAGREGGVEVVFLVLLGGASGLGCKVVLDCALQLETEYVGKARRRTTPTSRVTPSARKREASAGVAWVMATNWSISVVREAMTKTRASCPHLLALD